MFCNIFDDRIKELFEKIKEKIINFDKLFTIQKFISLVGNTKRDIIIEVGHFIHYCLSTLYIVLINVPHSSLLSAYRLLLLFDIYMLLLITRVIFISCTCAYLLYFIISTYFIMRISLFSVYLTSFQVNLKLF